MKTKRITLSFTQDNQFVHIPGFGVYQRIEAQTAGVKDIEIPKLPFNIEEFSITPKEWVDEVTERLKEATPQEEKK
jgi:hypothetical protein